MSCSEATGWLRATGRVGSGFLADPFGSCPKTSFDRDEVLQLDAGQVNLMTFDLSMLDGAIYFMLRRLERERRMLSWVMR